MPNSQDFLIQSSGSKAEHWTDSFADRTFADEVRIHKYYRNDKWDIKGRDEDFGRAVVGDYVLHYCTLSVDSSPGQIREIYEVTL